MAFTAPDGDLDVILFTDLAQDASGHTHRDDARWQILRDHRSRADDGVLPDRHAGADDHAPAKPHIVSKRDGCPVLPSLPARLRVDRRRGGEQLHPGGDLT